jgi:hypothetical protein
MSSFDPVDAGAGTEVRGGEREGTTEGRDGGMVDAGATLVLDGGGGSVFDAAGVKDVREEGGAGTLDCAFASGNTAACPF